MALRKTPKANLRKQYSLSMQIGMVLALAFLIAAFRMNLDSDEPMEMLEQAPEIVQIEEVQQTQQIKQPPPPPPPPVPIEVPNDEVLDDEEIDLDIEMDFDEPVDLPPPPPPPAEKEPEPEEPEIFMIVEDPPELIGGLGALQSKINYPEIAKKAGVEGTVFLQFVVDENGNVVDPQVVKGIGAGCDEEALRAVRQVKFKPGKQRGRPVKVRFQLPVRFRLK